MKTTLLQRAALFLTIATLISSVAFAGVDVRSRVVKETSGFRDVSLTARVIRANHDELREIGKDFQKSYDIKKTKIQFKAPDKMRMEGKVGLIGVTIIINGNQKVYKIPALHIAKREDITGAPHQRQSDLDLGILSGSLWHDYVVYSAVEENGSYKIVFARSNALKKKIELWADCETLKLQKVEKLEENGKLRAKYVYSNHKQIDGIWVPTKIEVFNGEGKFAAETGYENVKINSGIPNSVFNL